MSVRNIIYSIILHSLVIYFILANVTSKNHEEDNELHIKVEITQQDKGQVTDNFNDSKIAQKKSSNIRKEKIDSKKKPLKKNIKKNNKPNIVKSKSQIQNQLKKNTRKDIKNDKKPLKEPLKKESKKESKKKPEKQLVKKTIEQNQEDIWFEKFLNLEQKNKEKEYLLAIKSIKAIGLSNREKFNLYSQVKSCFKRAIEESGKDSFKRILVKIKISENGFITSDIADLEEMIQFKEFEKEKFAISVYNTKRAIEICNPLRGLPKDKYEIWKEVILDFSEVLDG